MTTTIRDNNGILRISTVSYKPSDGISWTEEHPFENTTLPIVRLWNTLAWKGRDAMGNEVSLSLNNPSCVLDEIDIRSA